MDDQVIRLILQTKGQESIDNLRKSTDNYRALLEQLVTSFQRGDVTAEEFERQQKQLGNELERQTTLLRRLEDAARGASAAQHTLADKADVAGKSAANLGGAMLQASRGIQDVAYGGIAGATNNVEGFAMALGASGGLAGALTLVTVAAAAAGPPLVQLGKSLLDGANELPPLENGLARVEEQLRGVSKEIDGYREKQSLTNTELARYNDLSARQVELEQEKAAEIQKQKDLQAYQAIKPDAQKAEEQAGAKQLQAALATSREEIENAVAEGLRQGASSEYLRLQALANRQVNGSEEQRATMQQLAFMRGRMGTDPAAYEANSREARDLLARAAASGSADDLERVSKLTRQATGPDRLGDVAQAAIDRATPAGQAKAREEAEAAKERDRVVTREFELLQAQAEERRRQDETIEKLNETLTKQGEVNEAATRDAIERSQAEDVRAAQAQARRQEQEGRQLAGAISKASGIDEAAAAIAGQMRQAGAGERDIVEALMPRITSAILQQFPQLSRSQAMAASEGLAAQAAQQSVGALLGLGQQNVDMTGQTIGTVNGMMGTVENMGRQLASYGAVLRDIQQRNRQTIMSTFGPNGGR